MTLGARAVVSCYSRRVRSADAIVDDCLDQSERALVSDALAVVSSVDPDLAGSLREGLERLERAADLVRSSPSILRSMETPRSSATYQTLLELMCSVPEWDFDLHVPVRVIFGQAYLVAKINFLKSVGYTLEETRAPEPLRALAEREISQSIYSKLGEELYISIMTDTTCTRPVRAAAARALFEIWERRLVAEIDDFSPVLESVWRARNKVRPVIGTTLGTSEFFALLREGTDTRFLDHFDSEVPEEHLQAFQEFLLGLSWEEIATVRERMVAAGQSAMSPEQARSLLRPASWAPHPDGPQALFTSYKKRRIAARYRQLTGTPGPTKTAEAHVVIAFLMREQSPE